MSWLVILVAGIFGTFVGSFLNVVVHRLPRNESVLKPPSRCYRCGTKVQWYDNLPILSYLVLRGRCRWCGAGFSLRYLLMEAATGVLTAAVVAAVILRPGPWIADWLQPWPLLGLTLAVAAAVVLAWSLLVVSVVDLEHTIIPDEISKSLMIVAPLLAMFCGAGMFGWTPASWSRPSSAHLPEFDMRALLTHLVAVVGIAVAVLAISVPVARGIYSRYCPVSQRWTEDDHRGFRVGVWFFLGVLVATQVAYFLLMIVLDRFVGRAEIFPPLLEQGAQVILGMVTGWMVLYLIGLFGTMAFRRNAMGFGDVKLLAPIGAFVGPLGVVYTFFLAAIAATLVGLPLRLTRRQREIPFGPWLALGALLTLAFGADLHDFLLARWS